MCSKCEQLQKLWSTELAGGASLGGSGPKSGPAFTCRFSSTCPGFGSRRHVTGYLGDCDSDVLVLGEAPSGQSPGLSVMGKLGSSFSSSCSLGYTSPSKCVPTVNSSCSFIRVTGPDTIGDAVYRTIGNGKFPFFSDMSKCYEVDIEKQIGTCFSFLLEEIKILEPKRIVCCGGDVFGKFKLLTHYLKTIKYSFWPGFVPNTITVNFVYHYSYLHRFRSSPYQIQSSTWPFQLLKSASGIPVPSFTTTSRITGIVRTHSVKHSTFII